MDSIDEEIEFLDEDADIILQYGMASATESNLNNLQNASKKSQLLVEKPRKRKKPASYDRDEDYDPKQSKKVIKKVNNQYLNQSVSSKVLIPDLVDSICLPVIIVKDDKENIARLRKWNKECVKQYKAMDDPLLPERCVEDDQITSKKTLICRNVRNKITGSIQASIRSKVEVKNSAGDQKQLKFSSVLPRFVDKHKHIKYKLYGPPKPTGDIVLSQNTVILTQENDNLVVYNPEERVSNVFKFIEQNKMHAGVLMNRRFLKEISKKNVCITCYQTEGKSYEFNSMSKTSIPCKVCGRNFSGTYTMLAHLKTHDQRQVMAKRKDIASAISMVTQYLYKCKICQRRFAKIMLFKEHLAKHKGKTLFKCDIGNHITR